MYMYVYGLNKYVIYVYLDDRGFLERKKKEKLKFTFESSVLHCKYN